MDSKVEMSKEKPLSVEAGIQRTYSGAVFSPDSTTHQLSGGYMNSIGGLGISNNGSKMSSNLICCINWKFIWMS